jgi:hypothetical protein
MACFLVPTTEAIVTTIVKRHVDAKDAKLEAAGQETSVEKAQAAGKLSLHTKLKWLNNMLWGGALLLLLEHIWHGEITLFFPFFTASPAAVLGEMATVGVAMAVFVSAIWAIGCFAIDHIPALNKFVAKRSAGACA